MTKKPVYNPKYELFKRVIIGKKVAILGIGVSNLPIIKLFNDLGAIVTACDKRTQDKFDEKTLLHLKENTTRLVLGEDYLDDLDDMEIIVKTPGIHPNNPKLIKAEENGAYVTSEMEMFLGACPCKTIGITGSDGKTTTTTLIYKMLVNDGYNCHIGGNIGTPLLSKVGFMDPKDIVIIELSSFQLQNMDCSPDIAVITNIAPNHLDYHKDMDEYINAKKNIFIHQDITGKLVINMENDITDSFEKESAGEVVKFSLYNKPKHGAHIFRGKIYFDDDPILKVSDIKLPGEHNVDNYLAAISAVYGLVDKASIVKVAKTFGGVPHRLEFVKEHKGIKYYNDSIASSPTRTTAGLKSFEQKVILIAGGYDKKIPFDGFGKIIIERSKVLILMGDTANKIRCEVEKESKEKGIEFPIITCENMDQAVKSATALADEGDIVLLSPACASFDMFKNFEERGNKFKSIVAALGAED